MITRTVPEIDLTDPRLYSDGDPFAVWRWLRANDPVRWQPPSELPGFWIVTRYEDVRAVYEDPDTFSSAGGIILRPAGYGADPGGGRTLALTDPPRHRHLRAIVDRWFMLRSIRSLEAEVRDATRNVIIQALRRGNCDFVNDVAARIPLYVICKLMGVPREDWPSLFEWTFDAFCGADAMKRRLAHLDILQYFRELVARRIQGPAGDIISAFVTAEIDGRKLTIDEVVLNCDNLLVGGTENARLAAAGGMLAFLQHPAQWRAVAGEPDLLRSAVEEVLRWTSSATHIMRTATRPVVLRGRHINEGDRVTLWNPSANRDESVFEDADRFIVGRKPNRHLTLGFGEHFCLGGALAKAELRILYEELLHGTERIELAGPPVRLSSFVLNGLERLPITMVPRREVHQ
ncbi:MAG TPA: cytochrome P450 [Candidatus Limnocylindrales bacterium]|nr:cytochrome P450 [Candidatus Limnocylindrales bacterium]